MKNKRTTPFLSFILYGLAVATLLAALYIFFSAFGFTRNINAAMQGLLVAFGPIGGLLVEMLSKAVAILGMVFAGLALTISALLFTAAQLLIQTSSLSSRIDALESRLQAVEAIPNESANEVSPD